MGKIGNRLVGLFIGFNVLGGFLALALALSSSPTASALSTQAATRYDWGTPMPVSDEFNYGTPGTPVPVDPTKWEDPVTCFPGHTGNGQRCAANTVVDGSKMIMNGESDATTGWLKQRDERQYGRWEMRVRSYATGTSGADDFHPVFLIWPTSEQWPQDGEYDFLENSKPGDTCAGANIHYPHPSAPPVEQEPATLCPVDLSKWHNVAYEWTPTYVRGFIDGVQWFNFSGGGGPNGRSDIQDMPSGHLNIQLDAFSPTNLNPANLEVDWVRNYDMNTAAAGEVSLGNYVWSDVNNDGIVNGNEANRGINDVTVNLYEEAADTDHDGTLSAAELSAATVYDTTTTANDPRAGTTNGKPGYYLFENIPQGAYFVNIPGSNFTSGPLTGAAASPVPAGVGDTRSDNRNHGSVPTGGSLAANGTVSTLIDLLAGDEPTTSTTPADDDTDDSSDTTIDFGFDRPDVTTAPPLTLTYVQNGNNLDWTLVYCNNVANRTLLASVNNPIPSGTTYVAGSVNVQTIGSVTTTSSSYDAIANKVLWAGTITPTTGSCAAATNRIVITYSTAITAGTTTITNQGLSNWDANDDGIIDASDANFNDTSLGRSSDPANPVPFSPTVFTAQSTGGGTSSDGSSTGGVASDLASTGTNIWFTISAIMALLTVTGFGVHTYRKLS